MPAQQTKTLKMNYENICKQVLEVAKKVGKYIFDERGNIPFDGIEAKGKHIIGEEGASKERDLQQSNQERRLTHAN